jgi:hypothetical protein
MSHVKASSYRLQYLDWVRGLAAVNMLNGHVWHSFLRPDLKSSGVYTLTQFIGGMPPAIFLFLTGVTLAFLMDSTERKGMSPWRRVYESLLRSRYLFLLAFAFRIQAWVFAGMNGPWRDMLRVDVLNCMGFSILVLSIAALFTTAQRIRVCAGIGLAIAFLAPMVSALNWSGVPWIIRDYIVPDLNLFGIFPWGAYLAFGVSIGSIIRTLPNEYTERAMQWGAVLGGVLILASQYFASAPIALYDKSDFWLNSPAQVLTKLGVIFVLLPVAFLWTRYAAPEGWSWVRQFGTTSLLVYWVHIELVYGHALWFCHDSLTIPQTMGAAILVVLLMLAISTMKTHPHRWKEFLTGLGWNFNPAPERAGGD